jgi:hypothetical protein
MSGKIIFAIPEFRMGWLSVGLVTKLGNGAIPATSGNPEKSLKIAVNVFGESSQI